MGGMGMMLVTGAFFGLAIYLVNFHLFTAVFPWFAMVRNGISIFSHVMFGAVLGAVYSAMAGNRNSGDTA
jgi:hypothetical protein